MAARTTLWTWILVLLLVLGLIWQWAAHRRTVNRLTAEHAATLQTEQERGRQFAERWAAALADREADAVFRAFAAGIQPTVMAGRSEALLQAKNSLLQLETIAFVHVVAPDGRVLVSSDDKYTTTGRIDDRASWVLETRQLTQRPGAAGMLELAGPITGVRGPEAWLWIGLERQQLLDSTRPANTEPQTVPAGAPEPS